MECEGFFDYEGYLLPSYDTRPYLHLTDGRWIARNDEMEDLQINRAEIQEFLRSFDGVQQGKILIKKSDDTMDDFFERIVTIGGLE